MKRTNLHLVLVFPFLPGVATGAGYYLPNQDALATARGNAFVATADSAAAVHYNPAGLTQLRLPEAQVGVYAIVLGNEAHVAGQSSEAKSELQAAPHIYYGHPVNDRISFGFGINSPFGLGTEWGENTPFSTVVTEARLIYASATPAVAVKITDTFSVGASMSLNYADLTLAQNLPFAPADDLRYEGDDFSFSGAVGLRWQPAERHAFGLVYSSRSNFDLSGKLSSSSAFIAEGSAEMDFITPARIAAGYSYRPAPGWNIEANVEWLDWDSLDTLTLQSDNGDIAVPFEWESSFIYELGASYTTPEGYVFAAGYDYNENAQPDAHFTPGVSDADRHWFNIGLGRNCDSSSWFLAYQFGYSNRNVDGSLNPLVDGRYQSRHHALVFSWQQAF